MRRLSPKSRVWRIPMALGLVVTTALTVTATGTTAAHAATTNTVVDAFASGVNLITGQSGSVTSSVSGADLLGGVRRSRLSTVGGGGQLATGTVSGVPDLTLTASAGVTAMAELSYDGAGGNGPVDPGGLGSVDLTDGGTNGGLAVATGASETGVVERLTVYSDATRCSTVSASAPVAGHPGIGSQAVFWRFADLVTASGCSAPADPAAVGAVVIDVDAGAAPGATVVLRDVRTASADYGDLPADYGVTTAAEGGAAAVIDPSLSLGTLLAGKSDGVHSPDSSADPDDDGVSLTPGVTWAAGSPSDTPAAGGSLDVVVTGTGCLSVWLGLDGGTDLTAPGDEVVADRAVSTGTATARFALPAGFALPATVVARARLFPQDLDGACLAEEPLGGVADGGEVEDYVFSVTPAPAAPSFTSFPASPAASQAPTWTFTQQAGTTESCQVTDVSGTVVQAPAPCNGSFTARLPRTDGTYTLTVVATDGGGRTSPGVTSTYQLDITPPAAPVITVAPVTPSGADQPAWQFTTPDDTRAECQLSYGTGAGQNVVDDLATCVSPDAVDLRGRPDGTYTFSVEAVDAAGNISAVTTSMLVRDTTAPTPPVFTAARPPSGHPVRRAGRSRSNRTPAPSARSSTAGRLRLLSPPAGARSSPRSTAGPTAATPSTSGPWMRPATSAPPHRRRQRSIRRLPARSSCRRRLLPSPAPRSPGHSPRETREPPCAACSWP